MKKTEARQLSSLPLLFRASFLERVAMNDHGLMTKEIINQIGGDIAEYNQKSVLEFLNDMYALMLKNYRCEYVFKNIVANKLFLARHSPKESCIISEFRSAKARADLVILNGSSTVYEIKTNLDSLSKLPSQIKSYERIFDKVYVVTTENMISSVEDIIKENVGIIVIRSDNVVSKYLAATSNLENLSPPDIFDCLRQHEYIDAVRDITGAVPQVPNTKIYRECKKNICRNST